MKKIFHIAIWGYGEHAKKNVLPAILSSDVCKLIGVCTTSTDKMMQLRNQYSIHIWSESNEMLTDPCVDTVYVCTPTGLHYLHAKTVLENNKNVFCEKTLAMNAVDTADLIKIALRNQLFLFETYMYFYHPQFYAISEIIAAGRLGKIKNLVCRFSIPPLTKPGYRFEKVLGGSAFYDVACYPLSMVVELLQSELQPLSCYLNYSKVSGVDISGSATLLWRETSVFTYWTYDSGYKADLSIIGVNGSLQADKVFSKPSYFNPALYITSQTGEREKISLPAANSFILMFEHAVDLYSNPEFYFATLDRALQRAKLMSALTQLANKKDPSFHEV